MLKIIKNQPLANFSYFKIGGVAEYFCRANTLEQLFAAIDFWREKLLPFKKDIFFFGQATNILFSDKKHSGLFVQLSLRKKKHIGGGLIYAESGVSMKELLDFCFGKNLSGLEWAGGLPGTLGGAIRGNAGAFGGEIKDVVFGVVSLDIKKNGEVSISFRNKKACRFKYRSSFFKEAQKNKKLKSIVVGVYLSLKKEKQIIKYKKISKDRINYRRKFHPMEFPTLGSTFKNIPLDKFTSKKIILFENVIKRDPFSVVPVAAVLDKAKIKGKKFGGVQFSEKHPNFMINLGKGGYSDALKLINFAKKRIKKDFSVQLEEEIEIVE